MHLGNKALKEINYISSIESDLAKRYREAGFIVIGRTNTPEFGLVGTTEPESSCRMEYRLRNRRFKRRSCSGRSIWHGTFCKCKRRWRINTYSRAAKCVGGLKPSRGRVPMGPFQDEGGGFDSVSRSVRDSAAILDASAIRRSAMA